MRADAREAKRSDLRFGCGRASRCSSPRPKATETGLEATADGLWVGEQISDRAHLLDWNTGKVIESYDTQSSKSTVQRDQQNWAGRPLDTYETTLHAIGTTTTKTGLTVRAQLVDQRYEKNVKITDSQMRDLPIAHHDSLPKWNYTLSPTPG